MSEQCSYAQWGEDRLVWDYFHRRPRGFFIEVGANDPINFIKLVKRTGSNNWYLPREAVFPVSLVERPRLFRKMSLATPLRKLKHALHRRKGSVPTTEGHR
jgi:hypothetical protein